MQFNVNSKIGARFKLVAKKKNGSISSETAWSNNLVLDAGLARMSVGTWINRCCVGTGNSEPTPTQTSLDYFLASTTTERSRTGYSQTQPIPYYSATVTWRFDEGVAAGNLSEVGLGWGDNNLWNRALIRDAQGNPTTITVLTDEYLDVVSEIRVYPTPSISGVFNLLDKTGAIISQHSYAGVPYIASAGVFNPDKVTFGLGSWVYGYSGEMNSNVALSPSGEQTINSLPTLTYPAPTTVRGFCSLGLSSGNGSTMSFNIRNISIMGNQNHGYKLQITPPILKTNTQVMNYTFEISWGRYTP